MGVRHREDDHGVHPGLLAKRARTCATPRVKPSPRRACRWWSGTSSWATAGRPKRRRSHPAFVDSNGVELTHTTRVDGQSGEVTSLDRGAADGDGAAGARIESLHDIDRDIAREVFADLVKRVQSLTITHESALIQTMTVQNNRFSLQSLRNLARVKCFFATSNTKCIFLN